MLLHDNPFFRSEVRTLFENFVRNRDFSQVMQISAAPQGHNTVFIQTKMMSKLAGMLRQAFAVAFGVGITAFDAEAQSTKHGFCSFQLVSKLFQFEEGFDTGEEFLGVNGLVQKVVGARFDSLQPVLPIAQSSD